MTHRTVQTAHINVPVAQSHSPPPCFVGPLMCSRDRTYSSFRRTASRNEQPETSSLQRITPHEHLSHDLVDYRGHPGRFRGDRRSHHRPNRHSGIGGDCRSADRRGFTLAATDHTSYYPTTANSPSDCATRRRYVGGRGGHCHRIDHARRRCCLTVDTADGHHLPPVCRYLRDRVEFTQALLCSPKSPLIRTSTVDVPLLPLPDCSQLSDEALCRCWRMSLPALQNGPSTSPSTTDALHLARTRATYLDEIERRDPRGSSPHEITHPHHISPDSTPLEMPMNQLRNLLMAGPVEND